MSEDRDYEVVDRRRVSAEAVPAAEAETTAAAGKRGGAADEASAAAGEGAGVPRDESEEAEAPGFGTEGMPPMDAAGVVSLCLNMLHEVAWVKLGLVADPMTQKSEKDLAQA